MPPITITQYTRIPFNVGEKPNYHCHCQHNDDGSYVEEDAYGCRSRASNEIASNSHIFTDTQHNFEVRLCNFHGKVVDEHWNINGECRYPACHEQCSNNNSLSVRRMLTKKQEGYCVVHFDMVNIVVPFEAMLQANAPTNNIERYYSNKAANWPRISTELVRSVLRVDSGNVMGVTRTFPQRLIDIIGSEFSECTYTTKLKTTGWGFEATIKMSGGMCPNFQHDQYEKIDNWVIHYNSDKFRNAIGVFESLGEEELTSEAFFASIGRDRDGLNCGQTISIPVPPQLMYYTQGLEYTIKISKYDSGDWYVALVLPPGEQIPDELCMKNGRARIEKDRKGRTKYQWKRRQVETPERMVKVLTTMYGSNPLSNGTSDVDTIPANAVTNQDILIQLTFGRLCKLYPDFVDKFRVELDNYKKGNHTEQNQIVGNVYTAIQDDNQFRHILIEGEEESTFLKLPQQNFHLLAHAIFGHLGGSRVHKSTTDEEHLYHLGVIDRTAKMFAAEHGTSTADPNVIRDMRENVRNKSGEEDMFKGFSKLLLKVYPTISRQQLRENMKRKRQGGESGDDSSDDSEEDSSDDSM